jgi:hypothetical protein
MNVHCIVCFICVYIKRVPVNGHVMNSRSKLIFIVTKCKMCI